MIFNFISLNLNPRDSHLKTVFEIKKGIFDTMHSDNQKIMEWEDHIISILKCI